LHHSSDPRITEFCSNCASLSLQFSGDTNESPFALVANTGDSRLVSDRGGSKFRAITKDHRVVQDVEDSEMVRLAAHKDARIHNKRVYPGGLAVTRTIGDLAFSSACVPTPDCYAIDLSIHKEQRFILATDGLWDSLDLIVKYSKKVGGSVEALVAQLAGRDSVVDPKTAATNLIKQCLSAVGGMDDITVIVMDVSRT